MYLKFLIRFLLSIIIAAACLWLAVRLLSDGDQGGDMMGGFWLEVRSAVSGVRPSYLFAYILSFLVVHVVRVHRWQYLIMPLGEQDRKKLFRICAVGFTAIVAFPLRLGELVRPLMLSKESRSVSFSAALGASVVERVIDGLVMTAMLCLTLLFYRGTASTEFVWSAGAIAGLIFGGAMILLILAAVWWQLTERLVENTIGRVSSKFARVILDLVSQFLLGVRVLKQGKAFFPFMLSTGTYWVVNGLGLILLAKGFGFDLSLLEGFTVLGVLVIGIMMPAGPGFVGNFQLFITQGLALFFTQVGAEGMAFALTLNGIQLVIQILFGIPFILASPIGFKQLLFKNRE